MLVPWIRSIQCIVITAVITVGPSKQGTSEIVRRHDLDIGNPLLSISFLLGGKIPSSNFTCVLHGSLQHALYVGLNSHSQTPLTVKSIAQGLSCSSCCENGKEKGSVRNLAQIDPSYSGGSCHMITHIEQCLMQVGFLTQRCRTLSLSKME